LLIVIAAVESAGWIITFMPPLIGLYTPLS